MPPGKVRGLPPSKSVQIAHGARLLPACATVHHVQPSAPGRAGPAGGPGRDPCAGEGVPGDRRTAGRRPAAGRSAMRAGPQIWQALLLVLCERITLASVKVDLAPSAPPLVQPTRLEYPTRLALTTGAGVEADGVRRTTPCLRVGRRRLGRHRRPEGDGKADSARSGKNLSHDFSRCRIPVCSRAAQVRWKAPGRGCSPSCSVEQWAAASKHTVSGKTSVCRECEADGSYAKDSKSAAHRLDSCHLAQCGAGDRARCSWGRARTARARGNGAMR